MSLCFLLSFSVVNEGQEECVSAPLHVSVQQLDVISTADVFLLIPSNCGQLVTVVQPRLAAPATSAAVWTAVVRVAAQVRKHLRPVTVGVLEVVARA